MKTKICKLDTEHIDNKILQEAGVLIKEGKLVAFPTETVYGLGADATNLEAVQSIFAAKNRPTDNPLIVHISRISQLEGIVNSIPESATKLIGAFWPGPLSIVLPKHKDLPKETTANLDTVVVRFPSHKIAQALIEEAGVPIAAPSANLSGKVSPTRAEHVIEDLEGRVSMIIDAGAIEFGLESTVIDCTTETPLILRPGSVSIEDIKKIIPEVKNADANSKQKSPGMKYRHYATEIPITLFRGPAAKTTKAMSEFLQKTRDQKTVVIWHEGDFRSAEYNFQLPTNSYEAGPLLFNTLRTVDRDDIDHIIVQGYDRYGIGDAIMNRLEKAASEIFDC